MQSIQHTVPVHIISVVVKDLRLNDKDEHKDLMSKDKDLKIGPRGQAFIQQQQHSHASMSTIHHHSIIISIEGLD